MGHITTKRQRHQIRQSRKLKKRKKMERQDSLGISRQKRKPSLKPEIFIILKVITIILIPVCYLLYSPLLILCVIFSASMFIFAILTENYMNHTFIKSNHIKILKIDSIIAIILIIIVIISIPVSATSKMKNPFGSRHDNFATKIESIGSCLTGQRSLLNFGGYGVKFGMKDFPTDMPKPDKMPTDFSGEFPDVMDNFTPPMNSNEMLKNLPVETVFSQILSSVNTIIIFLIPFSSLGTLLLFNKRRKKFDSNMNEVTIDEMPNLDEMDLEEIFLFGYELNKE